MYKKLIFIYSHHFKLVLFLNCCLSLFFAYLFLHKGFDKIPLYNLAIAFKIVAYLKTFGIEKLLFEQQAFYYRNLGLSYRKLFSTFFAIDFVLFLILLIVAFVCRSFI